MKTVVVKVNKPENINFILGQSHFIKTVEDIYEAIVETNPAIKFGVAFCEASGDMLIRHDGNDEALVKKATKAAGEIGAGHSFIIFMSNGWPLNIINRLIRRHVLFTKQTCVAFIRLTCH